MTLHQEQRGQAGVDAAAGEDPGRERGRASLLALADAHGVLPSYTAQGPDKQERHASDEALLAVLAALGVPVEGPEDVTEALRARRAELDGRLTPRVQVLWEGTPGAVRVALPDGATGDTIDCRMTHEDGSVREWRVPVAELQDPRPRTAESGGGRVGALPLEGVPRGVHLLSVAVGALRGQSWIISAPPTTWEPGGEGGAERDFGFFLPLYALRTQRSWGTADLTDLRALLEWSGRKGGRFVGTLPLNAAFLDQGGGPFEPGPYAPVSRLFWNELFLDVERAPGLEHAPAARDLLDSDALRREVQRLRDAPRVRYAEAMAVKRRVIEALAEACAPTGVPLDGPLAEFARRRPEAVEYARFRAAGERLAAPWSAWPEPAQAGALDDGQVDAAAFRYHLYAQYAMGAQVEALASAARRAEAGRTALPALYLDLPIGAHPHGFDVWRHRSAFASGVSTGAPPDAFFDGGQDWGFPPLHPERTRDDAHAYLRACLAHLMGSAGVVRLDHVMSLHRLYCVPSGHSAKEGAYVRYPAEELYAILCLESHRWRCEVVGEDLGTVPDEVRSAMERRRLRRMYVLPFELAPLAKTPADADDQEEHAAPEIPTPPELSVASLGTHDLPPFAAFWTGEDIEQRVARALTTREDADGEHEERGRWRAALTLVLQAGGGAGATDSAGPAGELPPPPLPTADALRGALARLAASPAGHLLINVEDLWLETQPQNMPGTSGDGNWTLKARHALEAWDALPGLDALLASVLRERGPGGGDDDDRGTEGERSRSDPTEDTDGDEANEWPT